MAFNAGAVATLRATTTVTIRNATINKLTQNDINALETAFHGHFQAVARTDPRNAVAGWAALVVPTQAEFNHGFYTWLFCIADQGTSPTTVYANSAFHVYGTDPTNIGQRARNAVDVHELNQLFRTTLADATYRQLLRTYADGIYNSAKRNSRVFQFGLLHGCDTPAIGFDCAEYISANLTTKRERRLILQLRTLAINQSIIDEDITRLREEEDALGETAQQVQGIATTSTRTRGHRKQVSSLTLTD